MEVIRPAAASLTVSLLAMQEDAAGVPVALQSGKTALGWAVVRNQTEAARMLLERGADTEMKDAVSPVGGLEQTTSCDLGRPARSKGAARIGA